MKKYRRQILICLLTLLMVSMMSIPAFAAELSEVSVDTMASESGRYEDVSPDSPYYTAIEYISDLGITNGTGANQFSPDATVTCRQWSIMACRIEGLTDVLERDAVSVKFGAVCLPEAYHQGWLSVEGLLRPDTGMCRGAFYKNAFALFDIAIYDYDLYPDGTYISEWENAVRIATDFGICEPGSSYQDGITREEAAQVLYLLLTNEYETEVPPMVDEYSIINPSGVMMNEYLRIFILIPENIREEFKSRGWTYSIDFDYISDYNQKNDINAVALCDSSQKTIFVAEAVSTIHEFGHFLDNVLGRPSESLWYEHEAAAPILREYALTNAHEYYADCFAYYLTYWRNEEQISLMRELMPNTYQHFADLAANDWQI